MVAKVSMRDFAPMVAIRATDAQKAFERICSYLDAGLKVEISFKDILFCPSYFLDVAIGQLYGKFDWGFLSRNIVATDLDVDTRRSLVKVIANAKRYFSKLEKGAKCTE